MTDYQPIECGLHSTYELAALDGGEHLLTFVSSDHTEQTITITPLDIITQSGEEFLVYRNHQSEKKHIRLDHILKLIRA